MGTGGVGSVTVCLILLCCTWRSHPTALVYGDTDGNWLQVSWLWQMSNNSYGREKASRKNCIWCFSLSELGKIDVFSSGFVTFLSFPGCTHKQRWHKCLWWILIITWDNLFWVSLQSSPSFLTWGLQHVLHLKSVWRLQLEQGIAACLGKGISQAESTWHLYCMIYTACQAASPL